MDGNTDNARNAAREILNLDTDNNRGDLKRDMITEGIGYVVIQGGYHSYELSDNEADFIARQLAIGGISQLEEYAKGNIA